MILRLYIAEKPSIGRVIAAALAGSKKTDREKTHIVLPNGDIVAWAAGHILAQSMPEAYGETYKRWALEVLPCCPSEWKMEVKESTKDLFKTIKKFLKEADEVVNAGDADREGQLLVDEVIEYCGFKGTVYRLLLHDTNIDAVKKALRNMQPNRDFEGMRDAALARSRADWLLGLNMTRAYTVLARNGGHGAVVRIGRVKTPTTNLVVQRDREIENFKPVQYWDLRGDFAFPEGKFSALWKPREDQDGLDFENRLVDKKIGEALRDSLMGKEAAIHKFDRKKKSQGPPLGYSLPELQIDASKRYGLAAHETLKICQALYEAGILTYPRSDCPYLSDTHLDDATAIVENIYHFLGEKPGGEGKIDFCRKARVFDSSKVAEHHAIIPTVYPKTLTLPDENSNKIFRLVGLRYLSWFFPDHVYFAESVDVAVEGEIFHATGKTVEEEGWRVLYARGKSKDEKEDPEDEKKSSRNGEDEDSGNGDGSDGSLPLLKQGERGETEDIVLLEKETKPPARFTEATLLKAMNNVHKFVKDPEIKALLKETDGIGTAATQASILKDLFDSGHLVKKGKNIESAEVARALMDILPEDLTSPDITALWEQGFKQIQAGEADLDKAISQVEKAVRVLVEEVKKKGKIVLPECLAESGGAKGKGKGKSDKGGSSKKGGGSQNKNFKRGGKCPKCGTEMIRREGKYGAFWGCSKYPECKGTLPDDNGKPGKPVKKESS